MLNRTSKLKGELLSYTSRGNTETILSNIAIVSKENETNILPTDPHHILYGACYHAFVNGMFTYITRLTEERNDLKGWFKYTHSLIPKPTLRDKIVCIMDDIPSYVTKLHDEVISLSKNIVGPEVFITMLSHSDKAAKKLLGDFEHYDSVIAPFLANWKLSQYSTHPNVAFNQEMFKLESPTNKKQVGIFASIFKNIYLNSSMNIGMPWIYRMNDLDIIVYSRYLSTVYQNPSTRHDIKMMFPLSVRHLVDNYLLQ